MTRMGAASSKAAGQFVGAGLTEEESGAAVEMEAWKFLKAARPWSREKIAAYLNDWCNANNLLSSQAQYPAFGGLVSAACMIDLWQRRLDECEKTKTGELAHIGEALLRAWRAATLAASKLDIKDAGGGQAEPTEAFMAAYDEP